MLFRSFIAHRPKTVVSTAEAVDLVFAHSITTLSKALSQAAIKIVESNTRERQRQSSETARKRQEEKKEVVREEITQDQRYHDQNQNAIKADQQRFERQRPPTQRR